MLNFAGQPMVEQRNPFVDANEWLKSTFSPQGTGYEPSSVPFLDPINAFGTSVVENIPIVGKPMSEFGNQVDAWIASALEGRPVSAEERAAITEAEQREFPVASGAGAVAGPTGALGLAAKIPAVARALGLTGPVLQRVLAGAASGGAITGADAVARGDDIGEALGKSLVGLGVGGMFPLAERGASNVVRAILARLGMTGPGAAAEAKTIARGLEREGINPEDLLRRADEIGPDAIVADLGPNMQNQAAAIAALPGRGKTTLVDALTERRQGANARIQEDVDAALGAAPVPSMVKADIRQQQKALSPEYETAIASAEGMEPASVLAHLDNLIAEERGAARTSLEKVRDMLHYTSPAADGLPAITVPETNASGWLKTRQAIDGMLDGETDRNVVRVLTDARKRIDEMLATRVPGIKDVDAKFEELAKQRGAVDTGQTLLDSGRTALRPEEVDALLADASEGVALRLSQGARAEIDRLIGTTANNITALKTAVKGDGSWNRERLASLFGAKKADRLIEILERETKYDASFDKVLRNSESAARLAGQGDVAPAQFERSYTVTDLFTRPAQKLANAAAKLRSEKVNSRVAEALANRPTPELIQKLQVAKALANRRGLIPAPVAPLLLTNQ